MAKTLTTLFLSDLAYKEIEEKLKQCQDDALFKIGANSVLLICKEIVLTREDSQIQNKTEQLACGHCQHMRCDQCKGARWGMVETQGIKCCQCNKIASLEVWRSGGRKHGKR